MSAAANFQAHQEEIMAEMQHVQELTMKSETGRKMLEASSAMAKSGKMEELVACIGDTKSEEEKIILMQYLGEILKRDPKNGMKAFSHYAKTTAENPQYADRIDYYLNISEVAIELDDTTEYQDYVAVNKLFEEDDNADSVAAREAIQAMQAKMKQWAGL